MESVETLEKISPVTQYYFNELIEPKDTVYGSKKKKLYFYSNLLGMKNAIDVTDDYCFKGIFRDRARAKDFLENVLVGPGKILPKGTKIKNLEYLETEYIQKKPTEMAKKSVFDLKVTTNHGMFIIEMQNRVYPEYLKRVEFYSAIAYSQQHIKCGDGMEDYSNALPVVVVSVISGKLFNDKVPSVSYHINVERKTQEQHMKAISYVFIELEKFNDLKYDQSNITDNEKDWLLFMKNQNLDTHYNNDQVNNAAEYIKDIRDNKYDEYQRHRIAEIADRKNQENARAEGKIEGRIEEKIEIAKNLLSLGFDITAISKATGLTIKEIEMLK